MKELFPSFLEDPAEYKRASDFLHELWRTTCEDGEWETDWLQTSFKDGTPFGDGDGILSAINRRLSRALKVIQTPLSEGSEVRVWQTSFGTDPPVPLTVVAGPLALETVDSFRKAFFEVCRGEVA